MYLTLVSLRTLQQRIHYAKSDNGILEYVHVVNDVHAIVLYFFTVTQELSAKRLND